MSNKNKFLICVWGILALLIVVEITLRLVWGFGKMPLYAASDKYEYMALPNLKVECDSVIDTITMPLVCEVMR